MMIETQVDAILAAHGAKLTGGGSVAAVTGWLISSQGIALTGLVVAILGFLMNWFYQARRDRRELREHEARMEGLTPPERGAA